MTEPFSQSQEARFDQWGRMVRAARKDEAKLNGIAPFRVALETLHADAAACRQLRDELRAQTREATQRLRQTLTEGEEAAARMRHYVKGVFGPRSEKLVRYGIKPQKLRRPPRKPGSGDDAVS
ncbi:MAG TPA: hypothetical protein VHC97_25050 [Thermoanaerobaculia bacterium]|jgi:hypothetical protein|nr:hypothetical protein [Thermoanaerobaculia bacterium]